MFNQIEKFKKNRIFEFIIWLLDYLYKHFSSFPMDFITEIHLRYYKANKNPKKKILGVWDFNQRLSRAGDFITFIATLNVIANDLRLKKIDLCFINDKNHYNAKQLRFSKSYSFKKNIKSLALSFDNINTILFFKSNKEFNQYYIKNRTKYYRWPPTISGSYALSCKIIEKYFINNKKIPYLELSSNLLNEIINFYQLKVFPAYPIVINIRNNNDRSRNRNSNIKEIDKFLKHYKNDKKYKFIVICNKSEFPKEFSKRKNVIFSKDYFEGIEFDVALIKTSYLSIFPGSGLACMAWHGNVPFIQYSPQYENKTHVAGPKENKPLVYFAKHQRFYFRKENALWLIKEFDKLIKELTNKNINNCFRYKITKKYEAKF